MSTNVGDDKVAAENVRRLRAPHRLATAQLAAAMVEAGRAHWLSGSGTAAIHVCDAACLCGGQCAETQAQRDLTARSSLGSPEVVALRESIPPELAERALRRAAEIERDAAIAERDALRDRILALADSLVWKVPEKSPCEHPEACCGSAASCDLMVPRFLLASRDKVLALLDDGKEESL